MHQKTFRFVFSLQGFYNKPRLSKTFSGNEGLYHQKLKIKLWLTDYLIQLDD